MSKYAAGIMLVFFFTMTITPITSGVSDIEETTSIQDFGPEGMIRVQNYCIIHENPYFKIINGTSAAGGVNRNFTGILTRNSFYGIIHGEGLKPSIIHYSEQVGAIIEILPPGQRFVTNRILVISKTLICTTLSGLLEFDDKNSNGLLDTRYPLVDRSSHVILEGPDKYLNLSKSIWTTSMSAMEIINNSRASFNITLETSSNDYDFTWPGSNTGDGSVESIAITINFDFNLTDTVLPNLPVYTVTGENVEKKQAGSSNLTIKRLDCSTKYSIKIKGWDFSSNDNLLYLTTKLIISEALQITGLNNRPALLEEKLGLRTGIDYQTNNQHIKTNYDTSVGNAVQRLQGRNIDIANSNRNLGFFKWSDNYTADDELKDTTVQLDGFFKSSGRSVTGFAQGTILSTLMIAGGFVYSAGNVIDHDPELKTSSYYAEKEIPVIEPVTRALMRSNGKILFIATSIALVICIIWVKKK
ncbi:MAG: hypothetical protein ACTSRU_12270 [Candidatus Hodarchaeales archaeon]